MNKIEFISTVLQGMGIIFSILGGLFLFKSRLQNNQHKVSITLYSQIFNKIIHSQLRILPEISIKLFLVVKNFFNHNIIVIIKHITERNATLYLLYGFILFITSISIQYNLLSAIVSFLLWFALAFFLFSLDDYLKWPKLLALVLLYGTGAIVSTKLTLSQSFPINIFYLFIILPSYFVILLAPSVLLTYFEEKSKMKGVGLDYLPERLLYIHGEKFRSFFEELSFLFPELRETLNEFRKTSIYTALKEENLSLMGIIVGLSFFVTMVSFYAGNYLDQSKTIQFQLLFSNVVFDGLTFLLTVYVLNWSLKQNSLIRIPIAITADLVASCLFAVLSLFLGLLGTSNELELDQILNILRGRNIQNTSYSFSGYFLVMHTAFLPTLFLLIILMVCWLIRIIVLPFEWFFGKGKANTNPLGLTSTLFMILAGIFFLAAYCLSVYLKWNDG